ncbi:hypothetical protein GCM10009547_23400 [Sporichthya brevicatena]|uniref:Uncharacterized protein n=1 Tax=Sporichthya brevicatena TaxID=171442 RepID=A0ABN1GUN6_9ACTN
MRVSAGRLLAGVGAGALAVVAVGLGPNVASNAAPTAAPNEASAAPTVGSCVDGDKQSAECADPAAVYEVLATARSAPGCPTGDYFFAEAAGRGSDGLCLGYNVSVGDCVQDDPESPRRVPCAPEVLTPTFRVVQVVDGRATAKACRDSDAGPVAALTYSVPKRTLCLEHLPVASR